MYFKGDKEKLKEKIASDFNIPLSCLSDEILDFIENFIKSKGSSDEHFEKELIFPPSQSGTLQFLIPKIYYFVNVKRTTWQIIGLLLDALVTKGLALPLLSLLGVIGQSVAKLNIENGEVCCYTEMLSLKKDGLKEFTEKDLYEKIKNNNKKCLNPNFNCIYKKKELCSTTPNNLQRIFSNLKQKSVISETKEGKWKVEL